MHEDTSYTTTLNKEIAIFQMMNAYFGTIFFVVQCIVHSLTVLIRGRRGRFGVHHVEHEQEEKGRCKKCQKTTAMSQYCSYV